MADLQAAVGSEVSLTGRRAGPEAAGRQFVSESRGFLNGAPCAAMPGAIQLSGVDTSCGIYACRGRVAAPAPEGRLSAAGDL